jgi:hypothetical protein
MQVQHHPCAGGSRSGQRSPAEGRIEVMSVYDTRSSEPNRFAHVPRVQPSPQQSESGTSATELGRVAREQLGGLAQVLADEPHQVLHHPLLAARRSVAVVEEQDHGGVKAYSGLRPVNGREPAQT